VSGAAGLLQVGGLVGSSLELMKGATLTGLGKICSCVAVAVGLGITQVATQHQLDSAHATSAAIAKVLDAPDARIEASPATVGGAVTVVVSALQREAVVTTSGMPSLSSSRVYQVWVMSSSGARSVGLLSSTDHIGQLLASGVQSGDQIGITVEPSGGTSRPTTTPVATVPLIT